MATMPLAPPSASKQFIANVIGRAWVLLSNVVFIPIYLHILGIHNFGVVALFTAAVSLISFLDMGLSPTLARELNDQIHSPAEKLNLLFTYEIVYASLVFIIVVAALLLPTEAYRLIISTDDLARPEVANSIHLVFSAAAVLLLFNFYVAGILGIEQQVKGNIVLLSAGVVRSAFVVLIIWIFPTPLAFLSWQFFTILLFTIIARTILYRLIRGSNTDYTKVFNRTLIVRNFSFSGSLFLVSIAAAVNTQIDKVFIGKIKGLEDLASYSMVSTFSQILVFVVTPISITLLPRLVRIVTTGDHEDVRSLFLLAYRVVSVIVCTGTACMIWFGPYLISLWTSGKLTTGSVSTYSTPLIMGYGLLALSVIPHSIAVAYKDMRGSMIMSLSVFVTIPSFWLLIESLGLKGAAYTWLTLQALSSPFYLFWVDKTLLHIGGVIKMLLLSVILPFMLTMICCVIGNQFLGEPSELTRNLSIITLVVIVSFLANFIISLLPSGQLRLLQNIAR